MPALDVLDFAMSGHHGTKPDFDAPGEPGGDFTDCRHAFGQLLGQAFDASFAPRSISDDEAEGAAGWHWYEVIMPAFQERYALWGPPKLTF